MSTVKTIKVWVVKFALTKGIYEIEANVCDTDPSGNMIAEKGNVYGGYLHGKGRQWCGTREEAVMVAEKMRSAKIASIKKQLAKLEKKTF
jgi:hypothetical protein